MVKWNMYAVYMTLLVTYKIFVSASHDIEVSLSDSVSIGCSPRVPMDIQWHHTGHMKRREFVYAGRKFYLPYKGRFQLGNYSLLIPSVNSDDSGLYECSEEISGRHLNSVHLTVLESIPVCGSNMKSHGYVGPNTCNLEQEDMTFTCAVSYNGKPPQMIWTTLNDSQTFNESTCKPENGRIKCSLILKADPKYDGSIFTCKSTRTSANCSTDVIRIQYFENHLHLVEKNISEKVNCSVKSNQILQFKWTKLQGNEYATVVKDQTLLIQSPGFYRCIVEYSIRNVQCSAFGSEVFVPNTIISCSETGQTGTAAIIVLLIIVVICVAGIIIALVLYRHQIKKLKRSGRKNSKEGLPMLSTDFVDHEESSAEPRSQTMMEDFPMEMLDMILLKTVRRMMVINSSEAFKSFDELMYQVLNHLRTISLLWDSRLHATEWVKMQLRRLRDTAKERKNEMKKSILDCYAIFVKDVDISTVQESLIQFKVVKTEKLNEIFNKSSNNESRCRAFLDHLFIKSHPLAFLAMKQVLDGNKDDILDYVYGRKTRTLTEEGSLFLSNDEIKAIVSTEDFIYDQLMAEMDPDRLGDWLKQERIITIKEWQESIALLVNIKDRSRSTLEYLSTSSHPRAYIILRQFLLQDNPEIASAIDNATSEAEKKYDTLNQIMKHREFLMERMDSEFGLLHKLRTNRILTNQEFEEIKTETTSRRLNGRLLDCISMNRSRNTADLFIEALKETDQGHLVNYLISDGVYDPKFDGEWPLTETEMRFIDSNHEALVALLDIDALLKKLYASDVINKRQREFISSKPKTREKREGFLKILRKTSQRNYKETILCLRDSNQDHIAEILETGEGDIIALEGKQNVTSPTHDRYNMRSHFRGLFTIINNEIFKDVSIPPRRGTERDAERLKTTFKQLGFEIIRHDNKTCIEMLQIMAKVTDLSNDYDCVAVAILTQGKDNDMIYGVGKENDVFSLDKVLEPLKGIKKGIPKLIFIPTSRGAYLDEGHSVQEVHDAGSNAEDRDIRVPIESDFLYHFATSPGYYSFRNAAKGTIFIQELCNVFDEYIQANVEFDVVKSLIQVNRRVAENHESFVTNPWQRNFNKKKQMPSFVCMLRKSLFLKKQI